MKWPHSVLAVMMNEGRFLDNQEYGYNIVNQVALNYNNTSISELMLIGIYCYFLFLKLFEGRSATS